MDSDVYLYKMSASQSFNKQTERKSNEYPSKSHTFAAANRLHRRVKAAAQHSSSELGSAFALHFTCHCKQVAIIINY